MRWDLVRVAPDRHVLLYVEHHLVHDGYSFNAVLSELTRFYNRRLQRSDPTAGEPTLKFQYADFAAWESRWMTTPAARRPA